MTTEGLTRTPTTLGLPQRMGEPPNTCSRHRRQSCDLALDAVEVSRLEFVSHLLPFYLVRVLYGNNSTEVYAADLGRSLWCDPQSYVICLLAYRELE